MKSRDFPKGNELAGRTAEKDYRKSLDELKGKKVAWPVEVVNVLADERVGIKAVTFKSKVNGTDRTFYLRFTYAPGVDPRWVKEQERAPSHFPTAGKPWVAKLKTGDKVILTGTIAEIITPTDLSVTNPRESFDQYSWWIRLDNHGLGQPK
jgi:hypothetical protein